MKNFTLITLFFISTFAVAQETDRKSAKATEEIIGTWVANTAEQVHLEKDNTTAPTPLDTYAFYEDGTFILKSKTSTTSDEQIITGNWRINEAGELLLLTEMDGKFPFKSKDNSWTFYIHLKKDRLSMYYRINDYTKSDFSKDQEVTIVRFTKQ